MSLDQVLTNLAHTLQVERVNDLESAVGERVHFRLVPYGSDLTVLGLPASVEVQWKVFDAEDSNDPLSVTSFESPQNTAIVAPDGVRLPDITLVFPVQTVELTTMVRLPKIYWIEAQVLLRYAQVLLDQNVDVPVKQTAWIPLRRIPISVVPVAIPTILALFQDTEFHGFLVVSVPFDSPLGALVGHSSQAAQRELTTFLQTLKSTVGHLVHIPAFASFLVGLSQLTDVLPSAPHFAFVRAKKIIDGVSNMGAVKMGYGDDSEVNLYRGDDVNDVRPQDRISSVIAIGPEKRRVELFNDPGYKQDHGAFSLKLGPELFALVRDLRVLLEHSTPESVPADSCEIIQEPPSLVTGLSFGFNDRFSSFRFRMEGETVIWDDLPEGFPLGALERPAGLVD
jgi:hypothetical protein